MTEWGRKTRKYFEKKIKKAKEVVAKARKGGGRRDADGEAGGYGAVDDAEAPLAPSRTPTLRRLKSQRSNKFDPDILAAWGMNPILFTNEDDSGERTDHMRVETISHHPGGPYSPSENPPSNFGADEREPLVKKLRSGRSRLSESGHALESPAEDGFYSPTWAEVPALRLRAIYFLVCFAMSISSPFFVLFMKTDLGLSAGQVGLVAALQIVGGYAVGPAVSLIVDRFQIHKSLWIVSILIGIVPVELITMTRSFEGALGIALSIAAVNAPISSLLDSSTLRFLGDHHGEYGKIRLFGAVGWGMGSLVAGSVVQFLGTQAAFHLFALCMVVTAAVVSTLDFTALKGWDEEESVSFLEAVTLLVPSWRYAVFLLVAIVAGFGATSLQSLMLMFLSDLGAPDILEGLTLSVATVSEMPIFWFSGAIIKRYGASSLLCASMAAFTVRSILVSLIVNPWLVLPLQLLHGFTFAGAWTAGVALAKQNSPVGLETSGQSVFSLAYNGIGGLTGSIVGGQLYDVIGPRNMYRVKALVFAVTMVAYSLTLVDWKKERGQSRSQYHSI